MFIYEPCSSQCCPLVDFEATEVLWSDVVVVIVTITDASQVRFIFFSRTCHRAFYSVVCTHSHPGALLDGYRFAVAYYSFAWAAHFVTQCATTVLSVRSQVGG